MNKSQIEKNDHKTCIWNLIAYLPSGQIFKNLTSVNVFKNMAHWEFSYIPGRGVNFQPQLILIICSSYVL